MFGRGPNGGGGARPVCKFFLEGRCKFGDGCKNEHPRNQSNRFAPLQNNNNNSNNNNNTSSNTFSVTEDGIRDDLTVGKERPTWPLSAYGPGIKAPRQLLEGPIEVSPEEMRALCYAAQAAGNPQEYVQHEGSLQQQVDQQISRILSDLTGAKRYVADGQNEHPNRNDTVDKPTQNFPKQASSTQATSNFGTNTSTFGGPSNLGAPKSGFGAVSALKQSSAFGAPSALGSAPGFGQPSTVGGNVGGFGKPSPFGQPSSLGQSTSAFGGAQSQAPFGQAPRPSPFGQPNTLGQNSAFTTQQPQSGGFGQPSAFGTATNTQSPFAQAASNQTTNANPFARAGTNQNASQSPFGQTNVNQMTNNNSNGFGAASGVPQSAGFGTPAANASPFATANITSSGFGTTSTGFNQIRTVQSSELPSNSSLRNRQILVENGVSYYEVPAARTDKNPTGRRRERVWFPSGPPDKFAQNLDAEGPAEAYTGELGKALEDIYTVARETGKFTAIGGVVPEIPPKRQWIGWDM